MTQGFVIWLTGLPSSGKTTLAFALAAALRAQRLSVKILDGDELRNSLSADLGYSPQDRQEQGRRVVHKSQLLISNGIVVIVSLISPYRETREAARRELTRFVEVYGKCPLEECIRSDVKGQYAKAIKVEIDHFTGISDPYEEPVSPTVTIETDSLSVEVCRQRILDAIVEHGYAESPNACELTGGS